MKFTDDPYVKETLSFLMTREVTHYKMFEAALNDIQPNFPPAVLAADPRYLQNVYNLSDGAVRGPWNEGEIKGMGKEFIFIEKPLQQVRGKPKARPNCRKISAKNLKPKTNRIRT
jgi:Mn-containing catalase